MNMTVLKHGLGESTDPQDRVSEVEKAKPEGDGVSDNEILGILGVSQTKAVKPSLQATKKCPHCAEEVKQDADKCRYCGEFFDPKKRTRPVNGLHTPAMSTVGIAEAQKSLIYVMLKGLLLEFPMLLLVAYVPLLGLILGATYLIARSTIVMLLAIKVTESGCASIAIALATAAPCIGLLVIAFVNMRATSELRSRGVTVGFMGARLD